MRIGLIGDSHGHLPALEAVVNASRGEACDVVVHVGDLVTVPFSPDPPGDSIALLRAEGIPTIYGNHELAIRSHGTPEWELTMALRMRRGYAPGPWVRHVPAGQAVFTDAEMAWLRALPADLSLADGAVYVCHSLPGNPFLSLDGGDSRERAIDVVEREAAFNLPGPARAELILCGHAHSKKVLPRERQTVIRTGAAIGGGLNAGSAERVGEYAIVTYRPGGWEIDFRTTTWRPTDPTWYWLRPIEAIETEEARAIQRAEGSREPDR